MNQRQKNLWTGTCSLLLANLAILQVTADLFSYESRAEVWQSSLCEETGHLLFLFLVLVPVIHDWTLLALANAVNGVGLFLLVATWQPVASQLLLSRERYIEVSLGTGPIAIGSGSDDYRSSPLLFSSINTYHLLFLCFQQPLFWVHPLSATMLFSYP